MCRFPDYTVTDDAIHRLIYNNILSCRSPCWAAFPVSPPAAQKRNETIENMVAAQRENETRLARLKHEELSQV